jgi:predicted transcriptional regulator
MTLTEKELEILLHISNNGKTDVKITRRIMKQGNALYERIWKLEDMNCITVKRKVGYPSLHSITEYGINLIKNKLLDKIFS